MSQNFENKDRLKTANDEFLTVYNALTSKDWTKGIAGVESLPTLIAFDRAKSIRLILEAMPKISYVPNIGALIRFLGIEGSRLSAQDFNLRLLVIQSLLGRFDYISDSLAKETIKALSEVDPDWRDKLGPDDAPASKLFSNDPVIAGAAFDEMLGQVRDGKRVLVSVKMLVANVLLIGTAPAFSCMLTSWLKAQEYSSNQIAK